jgi:predicted MFS family arabinose efflux permease
MSNATRRGIAIWLVTTLFLVYQNLLNTMFGLVTPQVGHDLAVGGAELGLLASAFGYAYGAMQIPVGVLFDRLNPRNLLTAATLACAAGAMTFAQADSFGAALTGRTLMGLGAALAYVGASTLMAVWWPTRLALMLGLVQLVDAAGSAVGQPVMATLSETLGWRRMTFGAATAGAVLALCIWLLVRRPPRDDQRVERTPLGPAVRGVVRKPLLWLAALYASGTIGTIFSYGVVWNVTLQQAFGDDLTTSAGVNAWLFVGVGLGAVGMGWLSQRRLLSRRVLLVVPPLVSSILIALLIFLPRIGDPTLVDLATAGVGFGCGSSVIVFEMVALSEPPNRRGTAIGFVNAIAFFAAAGLQALHGLAKGDDLSSLIGVLWLYPPILAISAVAGLLISQGSRFNPREAR